MKLRSAPFRNLCSWLLGLAVSLALPATAFAQCAMCKTSAENVDAAGVKYMNFAVLLLLSPPVAMFCGFFYLAYKRRNAPEREIEGADYSRTGEAAKD